MVYQNQGSNGNYNRRSNPSVKWNQIKINFTNETYVSEAEAVILELQDKDFKVNREELTTSQVRNLLALTSAIYTDAQVQSVEEIMDKIAYLRVQFVYQSGRNQAVKKFVELSNILEILKKVQETKNKEVLIRFCRYMEALIAYFKYYGGRD